MANHNLPRAGRVRLRVLSTLLEAASTRFECDVHVSLALATGGRRMAGFATARTCNTCLRDVFDMDALLCTEDCLMPALWTFVGLRQGHDTRSPRPRQRAWIHSFHYHCNAGPTSADPPHNVSTEKRFSTLHNQPSTSISQYRGRPMSYLGR
jgi:hypothetical protein